MRSRVMALLLPEACACAWSAMVRRRDAIRGGAASPYRMAAKGFRQLIFSVLATRTAMPEGFAKDEATELPLPVAS